MKIKEVKEIKFLVVTIDNKLSWDTHITYLAKKLRAMVAVINRISPYIQPENYKTLPYLIRVPPKLLHISMGRGSW